MSLPIRPRHCRCHPPGHGADQVDIQQFTTRISEVSPSITFYHFDYNYELVHGIWAMTGIADDRTLYSVSFAVVPPGDMPALASICGYQDMLS